MADFNKSSRPLCYYRFCVSIIRFCSFGIRFVCSNFACSLSCLFFSCSLKLSLITSFFSSVTLIPPKGFDIVLYHALVKPNAIRRNRNVSPIRLRRIKTYLPLCLFCQETQFQKSSLDTDMPAALLLLLLFDEE